MGSWKLDLCFHSGDGLDSDRCFEISLMGLFGGNEGSRLEN